MFSVFENCKSLTIAGRGREWNELRCEYSIRLEQSSKKHQEIQRKFRLYPVGDGDFLRVNQGVELSRTQISERVERGDPARKRPIWWLRKT